MASQNNQLYTGLNALPIYDLFAQMFLETKDPTSANYTTRPYRNFQIGTFWLNTTNQNLWYLADIQTTPKVEGNWVLLSGSSGTVESLSGNIGTNPVFPIAGNIKVFGDGIGINISGDGVNTLTASLVGGGIAAQSFPTDAGTATPDAAGVLNIKAQTATLGAGSSVSFSAPGSSNTVQLNVTDALHNTIIGLGAGTTGVSGSINTGLGYQALASLVSGSNNTAMGGQALAGITTGTSNTVMGLNAGSNYTGSDSANIVIGVNPGRVGESSWIRIGNSSGGGDVFIGSGSGNATYTLGVGIFNNAVGTATLQSITSGASNSAFGNASLQKCTTGSGNCAYGYLSGQLITTGSENVAIGDTVLPLLTTGSSNVAIGKQSLNSLLTGNSNICVGTSSGSLYTGAESNNICIGTNVNGTTGESNVARIGVGTGTGTGQLNATYICGINGITVTGTAVLVSASDQLGIAVSSARYKENIQSMNGDSDAIYNLRPVSFNYKADEIKYKNYGLIAEEVAKVLPELVVYDKQDEPMTVKYQELPVMLLNELQKQRKQIVDLISHVGVLEQEMMQLRSKRK